MPFANTRFHAVGQGCFYSGEIYCAPDSEPLRLVYDCGSETGGDALDREVALFHQLIHDERLDVLVLSHLDADHVNGLTLLLDNGLTARNVFLPYLNPAQRVIAAAGAGDEANPDYFELLANPVGFLEARGVENIIFISGGEDEQSQGSEPGNPPIWPAGDNRNGPMLSDLEDDREGKTHFHKGEKVKADPSNEQTSQGKLPLGAPHAEGSEGARPDHKANVYFKSDRQPLRLNRCWQGMFFHRDDMRIPVNSISDASDFTIRAGDSTSVHRYKRFLADVYGRFGTLDPSRLIMAIRDESDRKKLRSCYHHIRGNHNDVSLVFWHGPIQSTAVVRLESGAHSRGWGWTAESAVCNGGTLLTGDLTCTNPVVEKMVRHFGSRFAESAYLQVPHHGSIHSWNPRLLTTTSPEITALICAGRHNGYSHPHPQVRDSLNHTNGGVRWFVCDERNTVAMHIETT